MDTSKVCFFILSGFLLIATTSCDKYKTSVDVIGIPNEPAKDADGNEYKTVTIGTQTWFAENLKTTKYNDGTPIRLVSATEDWRSLTTGACCWYKNDASAYWAKYGALYNWFTIKTGKLCPVGWHIPSDSEWGIMNNYLSGEVAAGGKMKTTTDWKMNRGATNSSGFNALPGGYRDANWFFGMETNGLWWSSTEYNVQTEFAYRYAFCQELNYYESAARKAEYPKEYGFSVRCLKD